MHRNSRVYRFLTHEGGQPLTFGLIVDRRADSSAIAAQGLGELADSANRHPDACAFGKIAVLTREGIFTFQALSEGETVPVFCGNSTAAAIKCLSDSSEIHAALHGMAGISYRARARIEGNTVTQTWTLPREAAEKLEWRGCRVLRLRTLNDYAIVLGRLPEGVDPNAARIELLGPCAAGKLAIVDLSVDGPIVEFHNSNGMHGAVPQTGLATIALAARSTGWLRDIFSNGRIRYRTRTGPRQMSMPGIAQDASGGLALSMRGIAVSLTPLITELAA